MKVLFSLLIGVQFALSGICFAKDIKIDGGAAPLNNIFKKIKEPFEKATGHKLILKESGPPASLAALDKGDVEVAAAGVTIENWFKLAAEAGHKIADQSAIKYRVIGRDLIQVYVPKDIPVNEMSNEQLAKLFTGKATNWKEFGGPDLKITVIYGKKIEGTNSVFKDKVMGGQAFLSSMTSVETAPDIAKTIDSTPGSVGIGPVGLDTGDLKIKRLKIAEVGRPITCATKGAPSAEVTQLYNFIAGDGQKYISK